MARPRSLRPKYAYHLSGQARVWLDGQWYYLGEHDSPKSYARYYALCDQYHANDQKMPKSLETHPSECSPVTVRCVTADFREYIAAKFAHDKSRKKAFENLCNMVDDEYADVAADQFGPRRLAKLRELLVATKNGKKKHNTRRYINGQVKDIVRIFEKAVSRELIKVDVIIALRTLEPLREGETKAEESECREAVDIEAVRLTAKFLSPVIKSMVCIQVGTGMRPSELFRMRPADIEKRADGVWVYRPNKHKTSHHGKSKAVPIVGAVKKTLKPYLEGRDESDFCFKPEESAQWHRELRSAARVTPMSEGDRPGYTRATRSGGAKPSPYKSQFDKNSYRQAVVRAAKKAGTDHWTPYQLRHTAASVINDALGIDKTQALLGHSKRAMTEHYAKQSLNKAIEAAKAGPTL